MRKRLILCVMFTLVLLAVESFGMQSTIAATPPAEGEFLPDFALNVPQNQREREYLGLSGAGRFKIRDIKAEVVIIEIFSMYCPYCQKEAPIVNELFEAIQRRSEISSKIKVIGIGVGNTPYEVQLFKDRYQIPFPLLPDPDFSIHKILGEVRTPYFIVIRLMNNGRCKVVESHLGALGDPKEFLELILEKADIAKGA